MELRILGPFEVVDGGRAVDLGGGRQRALLALLALRGGEALSVDRIVDELWEEKPPETARKIVQVYVSTLRKALGETAIATLGGGYALRLPRGTVDLERFEDLLDGARRAEPAAAAAQLREALALWRGPPLADFAYDSFAQGEIGRLEDVRLAAVEEWAEAELAAGGGDGLVPELERLVRAHPLRERLRARLMLALYRAGRQVDALESYREGRLLLAEELGLEPGEALQQLEGAILRHDPSLQPAAAAPARPERSILLAPSGDPDALLALAEPLARGEPPRELIVARIVGAEALTAETLQLRELRERLANRGVVARGAAFTSASPGADLARLASEQDVDLLVLAAGPDALTGAGEVLDAAPCDVALVLAAPTAGPVLVPFGAAEHDWAALELGAWFARATGAELRLLGTFAGDGRDASRLLADASLLLQRTAGIAAEPLLAEPGRESIAELARGAGLLVAGLSERWRQEGLGETRTELAATASGADRLRPPRPAAGRAGAERQPDQVHLVARRHSVTTPIRTAERDGVAIAYQVTGRGPLDLLVVHDFAGHLELDWAFPGAARLFERLGAFARVIRFDKRGTGLSSREAVITGADADAADALAVLDAAGSAQAAVFAWGDGAAAALLLAARNPERVSALAVFGGSARPPHALGEAMAAAERVTGAWGERLPPGFAPDADDALRRWWTVRARAAATPAAAGALVLTGAQVDVRDDAANVVAPTLVLHRAGDTAIPPAAGKELAGLVPSARYMELPGAAHLPYVDPDAIADELETFFMGTRADDGRPGPAGYELERELGRGGMGTVHLARDTRLGRHVALKLLPPELAGDVQFRERFLREQRIAASIEHPNVVPIYDAGETDGRLYLAMRYIAGTDLKQLIEAGALEPVRAVRIVEQVAAALDVAHARGLVHRDVKPANVLVDPSSHAYLCDFGLTKETASGSGVTATGQLVGTLDYLAPEQIRGGEPDGRADVYALGCVLYACLTGRPPFGGRSEAQTLWGHMQEDPAPPSSLAAGVPPELDAVVLCSLAKEPQDRYASAGELADAARAALGIDAPAVVRQRKRGKSLLAVGALLLAIAVAAVVYQLLGKLPLG